MQTVILGEPSHILQINIPSIPDEDIPIGTMIILWNEIPIRKIGAMLYEVFANDELPVVKPLEEEWEEKARMLIDTLATREIDTEPIFSYKLPETRKYIRTSKGSKKVRPWEPPVYF